MTLNLGRIFAIYLPLAWIGVTVFGYIGVVVAAVPTNVINGRATVFSTAKKTPSSGKFEPA